MRSQASKPLSKKGDSNKTTFKTSAAKQTSKKRVSPKKAKNLVSKSRARSPKKSSSKDDVAIKNNEDSTNADKTETSDTTKAGPSKTRSDTPIKKSKKESKEKKDSVKNSTESNITKSVSKKSIKLNKKEKPIKSSITKKEKNNDAKYKSNINAANRSASKFSKAKAIIRKGNTGNQKKKNSTHAKIETLEKNMEISDDKADKETLDTKECNEKVENTKTENPNLKTSIDKSELKLKELENKSSFDSNSTFSNPSAKSTIMQQPETPKAEIERPPKFFTSSRSPRTVDIDVKCLKNSKGNLTVSDRFLSMKFESKSDDSNKDKNISNNLVSQGPDIDVYTFTEKVDSPKSILSDFRSPVNKNVGRVRPIARVKGTIIDKKTESEKKKYSPHRPIEEVVKQLKANKRSEELTVNQTQHENLLTTGIRSNSTDNEKDIEDKPKQIVSKSYKMVARKSSITGKPFSPIKFLDSEPLVNKNEKSVTITKKNLTKNKKQSKKDNSSDDELDTSKFALNTKTRHYSSSEESIIESNYDHESKESSGSDSPKNKKNKNKKYKRITDAVKKTTSKELKELSKDSLIELKHENILLSEEKPSKRRLKLLSMWAGPKKHRMASLNALAKVHCLYENESRTHMELGLMKTIDRQVMPSTSKLPISKKKEPKCKDIERRVSTSESEYENNKEKKEDTSESSDDNPPQRSLRGVPGIRSAGKYWDPKSSTSSSEDSELETKKKTSAEKKKCSKALLGKSESDKPPAKMKKTAGVPVKKKRNRNEVVMDLKDMVVQKRMASLNATAILAASYEKRSPKSNKEETTSDSCSDESFSQKPKNGGSSGVKSELKNEETKLENDETSTTDRKQKVEFVVNQDTDVTITGVYSTHHHEGFCTVSGMQYRISSTSHTQTTATANCEKVISIHIM